MKIAAHSFSHLLTLYIYCIFGIFVILVISHLDFESKIGLLIVPVPIHSFHITLRSVVPEKKIVFMLFIFYF